ncbi:hypothetical protein [Chondromyces crocatus]|uniref:Uncharacterized protein n=1 Tax=Chondromyces crocatus TaxID=52 RepID=A0A0K1EEM4_CHOCO|nr:hypothetical protein [Chondromyces crocatus]AKT39325.1 uncharacterized protein CMC5_034720 [Chondromyces crocatus]
MRQPKKRRAPRAPFILTVTVAATSALTLPLLAGCTSGDSGLCIEGATCNPPFPPDEPDVGCPEQVPVEGGQCADVGVSCSYPPDTSCPDFVATCDDQGTWDVNDLTVVSCNPPPLPPCDVHTTEADCGNSERSCRWLVPGCAEPDDPVPALAEAGCFEAVPCVDDDFCSPGLVCAERVFDPCHGMECDACGQTEMLCVAP